MKQTDVRSSPERRTDFLSRLKLASFLFSSLCFLSGSSVYAQENYQVTDSPPPLKVISAADRKLLNAEKNVKDRTKLALELMEIRLAKASAKSAAEDFAGSFAELGAFHALMDDTLSLLDRSSNDRKQTLNNFKRLEIGLRRMAPQLEILRREAPPERERYIYYLAKDLRETRAKAIEPLFSDTVLPNRQEEQP